MQLSEKWLEERSLPTEAALIEGQALFHLCLMDRAWAKAREVLESRPNDIRAMVLLADIYLRRGWTGKARKVIAVIRQHAPSTARLDELEKLANAPSIRIPNDFESILQAGTVEQKLDLAECSLGLGKLVLARKALFRTLAGDPRSHRARHLLWALEGDLKPPAPLSQLWDIAIKFMDEDDGIESTVSMPQNYIDTVDENDFPHLFRNSYSFELTEEMTSTEMTMEMGFANQSNDVTVVEDPNTFHDTQILDFVGEVSSDTQIDHPDQESEIDQDVIVMTSVAQTNATPQIALQQVQLIKPPDKEELEKTEIIVPDKDSFKPIEQSVSPQVNTPSKTVFYRILVVLGGVAIVLAICVSALVGIWKTSEQSEFDENMVALLSASPVQLQKRKAILESEITANRSPLQLRKQYLGLVCASLWRDFTGRQADLECAQRQLQERSVKDENWIDLATKATIAMGNLDYPTADVFLHEVDEDNELLSLLRWEIKKQLTPSVNWSGDVSSHRQFISIVRTKNEFDIPEQFQDNLWIQVLQLEWEWNVLATPEKEKRVADLLARKADLESKLHARVLLLQSFISPQSLAPELRKKARQKDPYNSSVLYWTGWDSYADGRWDEALSHWTQCQYQNVECAYSQMLIYIHRDQLQTAHEFAIQFDGDVSQVLSLWIRSEQEEQSELSSTDIISAYLQRKEIDSTSPLQTFLNDRVKTIKYLQNSNGSSQEKTDIPFEYIDWLRHKNQLKKAHQMALGVVSEKPNCARCYRSLLEVQRLLGRKYERRLRDNMKKYLALKPNGEQMLRLSEKF